MLTPTKWQFKFFDVAQVKLPDDESSFLSEVWGSPSLTRALSLTLHSLGTSHPSYRAQRASSSAAQMASCASSRRPSRSCARSGRMIRAQSHT